MSKINNYVRFLLLTLFSILGIFVPIFTDFDGSKVYNYADISWMLIASALVLLMTPGLSFFYGGMVTKKNVISTMMQSFIATGLISVLWIVVQEVNAAGNDGLFYGGVEFFGNQVLGCVIVVAYSLVVRFILFKLVDLIHPMRVSAEAEEIGLDITQHDERL